MTRLNKSTFATAAFLAAGLAIAGLSYAEPPAGDTAPANAKVTKGEGKPRGERRGPAAGGQGERRGPGAEGNESQESGRPGPGGPGGPGGQMGQQRDGQEHLGKFWENERVAEALQLTPEQLTELNEAVDATTASLEAIKGDGREAQEELREELEKDNPDITTVNRLVDSITASQAERMRITTGHRVAVQSILTADQEKALKDARRGGRGGQGRGQMRGEGAGEGAGEGRGEGRGKRGEGMGNRFEGVKTIEDLNAALDKANVPEERRERIIQMWERRQGAGTEAGEGDEMGLPPLPPEL